jgi:hypothetical protein
MHLDKTTARALETRSAVGESQPSYTILMKFLFFFPGTVDRRQTRLTTQLTSDV